MDWDVGEAQARTPLFHLDRVWGDEVQDCELGTMLIALESSSDIARCAAKSFSRKGYNGAVPGPPFNTFDISF